MDNSSKINFIVFFLALIALMIASEWALFAKAGQLGWLATIPAVMGKAKKLHRGQTREPPKIRIDTS